MDFYDLIVIGAGPAGLSAAIYMARAKYKVLVLEKEKIGGQITITSEVVNYPGIEKTDGTKLTQAMRAQAQAFGAEFEKAHVTDVILEGDYKTIKAGQKEWKALSVIIAAGASPRKLGFKGEKEYQGRGVAYCATCDGEFFSGMDVFVIGGGFAAAEEAMFLTRYAKEVKMIIREPDFTCARSIADQVKKHPGITIQYNTEIIEAGGDDILRYAVFCDNETNEIFQYEAGEGTTFGIFVFAGYVPASDLVKDKVALDEFGYIITDENKNTNIPGVCAAGDICVKNLRQVVTAVSDGAIAATTLEKYVAGMYEKLHIERQEPNTISEQREEESSFMDEGMTDQLKAVFERFQSTVRIKAYLDERAISAEVDRFLKELSTLTDKIELIRIKGPEAENSMYELPYIELCDTDDRSFHTGFHWVPGGHEINSFILSLYNAAGPGQQLDDEINRKIKDIKKEVLIQVVVSLSCTKCPDLVTAVQRIAIENPNITAEIFDMSHFPDLRDQYKIMSVPCMIINKEKVYFGKKEIDGVLDILNELT